MKRLSIRLKITLWFSIALIVIVGLTITALLSVSDSVLKKGIQDNLIEAVEHNVDEIEFYNTKTIIENDHDADHYIEYNDGYLEVDDDFLDSVNSVTTALYLNDGVMLYGENPQAKKTSEMAFSDKKIQKFTDKGVLYFVFDRKLNQKGLENLWLRGVVSEKQGTAQILSIVRIFLYILPTLLVLAILGGYWIACRSLKPIVEIKSAAEQIEKGMDLKKRIELSPGKDELHQLAETFNGMLTRLDNSFENERRFTSDVSHELRTPMAVIMAQCEYSLEQPRTAEEYEEALNSIRRQGGKMTALIDDMLKFTRLEQKSDKIKMEKTDLSALVTSVTEEMALLRENGIKLNANIEKGILINGNIELLRRLIVNLIDNAYRYGKADGNIKVELFSDSDDAVLTVEDDGIGIQRDQMDKIFNRFYQIDSSRSGKGTGLGLSFVKEIAGFHNGSVTVESEPQKGSIFTVRIKK